MKSSPFIVGKEYRRRDVYRIIGISEETRGGNWETGYNKLEEDWYLFCNVGVPGNSGHDYPNEFVGDDLRWFGKTNSSLRHDSIQSMINGTGAVYIFTRDDPKAPFIYSGRGVAVQMVDSVPVEILWGVNEGTEERPEVGPGEIIAAQDIYEGATKSIRVNIYERNPLARRLCTEYHGFLCSVCEIDLEKVYGDIAHGFIHVHHLKPLYEIDATYRIDPIKDLRPVCPTCHSMLHRRKPVLSIDELRTRMHLNKV